MGEAADETYKSDKSVAARAQTKIVAALGKKRETEERRLAKAKVRDGKRRAIREEAVR